MIKNDPSVGVPRKIIGKIGENIARRFLVKQGYSIITMNYLKKCGEIDIVAKRDGKFCFVEVKTVSAQNVTRITSRYDSLGHKTVNKDVNHETSLTYRSEYRPEENVGPRKLNRMQRTINLYLMEKGYSNDVAYETGLVTVRVDLANMLCKIEWIKGILGD